jgi:hypothetical protein
MPITADQTQAQTTTPVDLGAIFVGIEQIDMARDRSFAGK